LVALRPDGLEAGRPASKGSNELPRWMAKRMFTNGMSPEQRAFSLSVLIPDASRLALERVDRSALPDRIPRSWVLTRRDRSLPPRQQRRLIENLGRVEEVIDLDTCHNAMISRPWIYPEDVAREARPTAAHRMELESTCGRIESREKNGPHRESAGFLQKALTFGSDGSKIATTGHAGGISGKGNAGPSVGFRSNRG